MGDCVHVYGVLLVVVFSRGVVWLMLCVFDQAHALSNEGKKKIIQKLQNQQQKQANKKNKQTITSLI